MTVSEFVTRVREMLQASKEGKQAIAEAITSKGVPCYPNDRWEDLAINVGLIEGGGSEFLELIGENTTVLNLSRDTAWDTLTFTQSNQTIRPQTNSFVTIPINVDTEMYDIVCFSYLYVDYVYKTQPQHTYLKRSSSFNVGFPSIILFNGTPTDYSYGASNTKQVYVKPTGAYEWNSSTDCGCMTNTTVSQLNKAGRVATLAKFTLPAIQAKYNVSKMTLENMENVDSENTNIVFVNKVFVIPRVLGKICDEMFAPSNE